MSGAADEGNEQAVAGLLDEGGDVDARCAELDNATLLMNAAAGGQHAMLRMLLQRGASINLQDSFGTTALMAAAVKGHATIVQALNSFKSGANRRSVAIYIGRGPLSLCKALLRVDEQKPCPPRRAEVHLKLPMFTLLTLLHSGVGSKIFLLNEWKEDTKFKSSASSKIRR